jgi:Putative transposase/Transposase zinc-binding domain
LSGLRTRRDNAAIFVGTRDPSQLASRAQRSCAVPRTHAAHHVFERRPGDASAPLPRGYRPRRPHATAFYRTIATHLETMLAQARARTAHGFGLPRYVEETFRRYLDCGVVERGFARVSCPSCQYEMLVPFSCKLRGLCPSCEGRRMADGAAALVDRILPRVVDYRQWTLSFPRALRVELLRDPDLVSRVLRVFVQSVSAFHRRRARQRGVADGHTGTVTAIQRAGSFANANVHFHTLVPEGVWHEQQDGTLAFHPLPPPTDDEVEEITRRIVRRLAKLLAQRQADAESSDAPQADDLAHAQAEAVQLPIPLGSEPAEPAPRKASRRRCALVDGVSLHANTSVDAADRPGLERLCRYLLRPLISADRLTERPDGRVEYRFRHPDPTGRTSWVTDGPSWCRRLATLIPPRRRHTTLFHGILSSAHRLRARVVPASITRPATAEPSGPGPMTQLARRLDWAALLRRVYGDDVTRCPRCGDTLRVLAFLTDPRVIAAILDHLGLRTDLPPRGPARAPPDEPAFDFGC